MTPRLVEKASPALPSEVVLLRRPLGSASSLVVNSRTSAAAESIRALRTDLIAQHFQAGRRALTVCAPSAGVGCTFIAANLALALSQTGVRTLLVDANLRDPSLHTLFAVSNAQTGLVGCLVSEEVEFSAHVQTGMAPELSVMFAGGAPDNPQELLAGDRFRGLVDFCLREFQATIFDTAPANVCADARRVSSVTGYGLIVTRRNKTYVEDVRVLVAQLTADHAHVVGCVLNEG